MTIIMHNGIACAIDRIGVRPASLSLFRNAKNRAKQKQMKLAYARKPKCSIRKAYPLSGIFCTLSSIPFPKIFPGSVGTAGQRVVLYLAPPASGHSLFNVTLMAPGGNVVSARNIGAGNPPEYSLPITLPATGTYTVLAGVSTIGTANTLTLTLNNVPPDVAARIAPDGPPVTVTTTVIGQNAAITFNETMGHRVSFLFSNNSYNPAPLFHLLAPDGSSLESDSGSDLAFLMGPVAMPETGTYAISLQPDYSGNASSGSITLTMWDVPSDATGSIAINGTGVPITITTPGQKAQITFSGTAGQSVTVQLTSNNICRADVSLSPPGGGSPLASAGSCAATFNLSSVTLSATGTYTIVIAPEQTATGSIMVAVTSP